MTLALAIVSGAPLETNATAQAPAQNKKSNSDSAVIEPPGPSGNNVLKFQTPDSRFEGYAEPLALQPDYLGRSPRNPLISRIFVLPKIIALNCLLFDARGSALV